MTPKQGPEETEFVKEETNDTKKFVFQKNTKTKVALIIIIVFLGLLILGVVFSGVWFDKVSS